MRILRTELEGCLLIEPTVYKDQRGYFFESFNHKKFSETIGREVHFVQDNQSRSKKGVIRALHYQIGEYAQAKLVRVLHGKVLDVAVDLRKDSDTFGQHVAVELSHGNMRQLFIPRGFAHGFAVLSETAEFFYKCDNYYYATSERGVLYNDVELNIDWMLSPDEIVVSEKDASLPLFRNAEL